MVINLNKKSTDALIKMGGIETPTPVPRNLDHMLVRASPSLNSALDAESTHMTNKMLPKAIGDGEGTIQKFNSIPSGGINNSYRPSDLGEYQNDNQPKTSNFIFQEETNLQ